MFDTSHLHPMLVHFPIALGLVGFALEALSLFLKKKCICSDLLLYFATLSAIFALISGLLFTGSFTGKTLEIKNTHELFAYLTTILSVITSLIYLGIYYKKINEKIRILGFIFYALTALAIGATGFMGGTLTYNYLIGL